MVAVPLRENVAPKGSPNVGLKVFTLVSNNNLEQIIIFFKPSAASTKQNSQGTGKSHAMTRANIWAFMPEQGFKCGWWLLQNVSKLNFNSNEYFITQTCMTRKTKGTIIKKFLVGMNFVYLVRNSVVYSSLAFSFLRMSPRSILPRSILLFRTS